MHLLFGMESDWPWRQSRVVMVTLNKSYRGNKPVLSRNPLVLKKTVLSRVETGEGNEIQY